MEGHEKYRKVFYNNKIKLIAYGIYECYTLWEQSCYRVDDLYSYIEWEVMLMNNKHFDFKDLMAFGMFILALLTFVFSFIR